MVLASLNALGRLHGLHIERRGWTLLYYSNYYFLVLGGLIYLTLYWIKSRVFLLQPVVDFAFGLVIYNALYYLSAHLLIRGWVNPWTSVIPGLVLIAYGVSLRYNRGLWTPTGL